MVLGRTLPRVALSESRRRSELWRGRRLLWASGSPPLPGSFLRARAGNRLHRTARFTQWTDYFDGT
jgi:hypothetical protein